MAFVLSREDVLGLANALIFLSAVAVLSFGWPWFVSARTSASSGARRQAWTYQAWRLVPTWCWPLRAVRLCAQTLVRCWAAWGRASSSAGRVNIAGTRSELLSRLGALAPAGEQLTSEVALLLQRGRVTSAAELVRAVRSGGGPLQPGPSCFRMLLQTLARAPTDLEQAFARLAQDAHLHSLPLDAVTEGCRIRSLCRAHGDVDKAFDAYTALLAKGVTPDARTTECLAEFCIRAHRPAMVKRLVLALDDHGVEPSAVLCASLIAAIAMTGALACGMAAFDQMRPHMEADPAAMQLAYVSVIHMCAQNHQVGRALGLFREARQAACEKALPLPPLEGQLLPPLLAAAVQTGQEDLALELAAMLRAATAVTPAGSELAGHVAGLSELLMRRHASRPLMTRVADVLAGPAPAPSPAPAVAARSPASRAAATYVSSTSGGAPAPTRHVDVEASVDAGKHTKRYVRVLRSACALFGVGKSA